MFLKNKNIIFKIRRSKVTDYAALNDLGHLLLVIIVNPWGRGHLAGNLPQMWPRSAVL